MYKAYKLKIQDNVLLAEGLGIRLLRQNEFSFAFNTFGKHQAVHCIRLYSHFLDDVELRRGAENSTVTPTPFVKKSYCSRAAPGTSLDE